MTVVIVLAVVTSVIAFGNLWPDDSIAHGCPGIIDSSGYVTAEATTVHHSDTNRELASNKATFTSREADIFRSVAFSENVRGDGLGHAQRWQQDVVAIVIGPVEYVDESLEVLATLADLTNLDVRTTADPGEANLTICVGLSATEHRTNSRNWFYEVPVNDLSSPVNTPSTAAGRIMDEDSGEITEVAISTARMSWDGGSISRAHALSAITTTVTAAFGLRGGFDSSHFSDVNDSDASIFAYDAYNFTLTRLDQQFLTALYRAIPVGSTWQEALDYVDIVD